MVPPACLMLLVSLSELWQNRRAEMHLLPVQEPEEALAIADLPEPVFAEQLKRDDLHPDRLSATLARWLVEMRSFARLEAYDLKDLRIELDWHHTECSFWVMIAPAQLRPPFPLDE